MATVGGAENRITSQSPVDFRQFTEMHLCDSGTMWGRKLPNGGWKLATGGWRLAVPVLRAGSSRQESHI